MAKLNKAEVEAIANKLHIALEKKNQEDYNKAVKNYKPSELYSQMKELLEQRQSLQKSISDLQKEEETVWSKIYDLSPFYFFRSANMDEVLRKIISEECKITKVISVDEIKNDIVIAAIDSDFDVNTFINEYINKL